MYTLKSWCTALAARTAQCRAPFSTSPPIPPTPPLPEQMLSSGSRSCQSIAITAQDGRLQSIVSPHYHLPQHSLHPACAHALHETAQQAGARLDWYHHTVILDAIAHARAFGRNQT
ncbi:hypothetical protein ABZ467_31100 [Streptomyces sp. NPDC005727]|uniref:hypothetical protein n=1 Tax=Streptomyces sp. NPDC005727 TaxID=3157053 RepID=UPI0033CA7A2A